MTNQVEHNQEEFEKLFSKSCEEYEQGKLESALSGFEQLLSHFPGAPILLYNKGLVCYELKRFHEAVISFKEAADAAPQEPDILFNLGLSHKQAGNVDEAIAVYCTLLEVEPDSVDALYNLGGCYKDSQQFEKAVEVYNQALDRKPDHLSANNNLAYVYQVLGDSAKAISHYKKVLASNPDHEGAKHMLAALSGEMASSSPESYVREVFDNYSDRYEESLVAELEYNVPEKLYTLLQSVLPESNYRFLRGLDLGCGTGLSGKPFAGLIEQLDGIDLAPKMIEIAHAKNIYHQLFSGNIIEHLQSAPDRYDLFLAADVLGYMGELEPLFSLLGDRSEDGAYLLFSTEYIEEGSVVLRQSGRFAHSRSYIKKLAISSKWEIKASIQDALRKDRGQWVQGDLWVLQKKAV